MDNALHAAVEFVQNHSDQTFTVDAGDILGVEGSITVTETDSGINFSGRLGGGLGIGFGGSADLIEGHAGSTGSGWGWLLSGAGGMALLAALPLYLASMVVTGLALQGLASVLKVVLASPMVIRVILGPYR